MTPFERTLRMSTPAAIALLLAVGVAMGPRPLVVGAVAAIVGVGLTAVVALRPLSGWPAAVGLGLAAGAVYVVCAGQPANIGWFTMCVLAGWVALVADVVPTAVLTGVLLVGFGVQWAVELSEPGWGPWTFGTVFTAVACVMARRQRQLLAALQEAQAGLAERAAAEERNRIAHELHDVIGHALTVSLLHVTSARLALDEDPVEAAASLAEAERLAQQSLAEVRAVVGLMKDAADTAPLPGAAQLGDLVASFDRAGAPVDWTVVGDPSSLTATEGLTVYRILQEALTNAARHAPGAATAARVEVARDRTRVVVDSAGTPHAPVREGSGLVGMRQRAEALGGALTAGPHDAGWRVEAVLPS
ncbi:sensor histidine kinase [Nocardioides sp.]|uniref:sensor histidine kinase n=1 Tax=Nocardioides sp. TaxID=35761 RepID=UPI002727E0D0|nr:histidine kinase [Nocardioides sp.]MDO9454918.1 histidine kinase [Nocardioides sp.]